MLKKGIVQKVRVVIREGRRVQRMCGKKDGCKGTKGEKNFGTTEVEEMDEPNSTRTEKTEIVGKVNGAFTNIVERN